MASPIPSSLDAFNHYNTEFVKLDAQNWQDSEDGTKLIHIDGLQFGLLELDEVKLFEKLAPDSVNVLLSSKTKTLI